MESEVIVTNCCVSLSSGTHLLRKMNEKDGEEEGIVSVNSPNDLLHHLSP